MPQFCHPERSEAESRDLVFLSTGGLHFQLIIEVTY
jgi:hypothetical protein